METKTISDKSMSELKNMLTALAISGYDSSLENIMKLLTPDGRVVIVDDISKVIKFIEGIANDAFDVGYYQSLESTHNCIATMMRHNKLTLGEDNID